MTIQELQEIVGQLGLIDLGEAQQYWGNGTTEKEVNGNNGTMGKDVNNNNGAI
ncbi:hypothetical protein [Dictyobacter formicarum]|uniref:Uncharacterized protein n=1 Tax=Dictyobacter formicarum TaxID=2778368 RepID=A0ABQ3VMV9_9CHLR|nr:hypothetical protein [Dictyobacter formicarum]GHO87049.1 hypothetical protein KSZ_50550 [Dictyobacter formicarum]